MTHPRAKTPQGGKVPNFVPTRYFWGEITPVFKHWGLLWILENPYSKLLSKEYQDTSWSLGCSEELDSRTGTAWLWAGATRTAETTGCSPQKWELQLQQAFCTWSGLTTVLSQGRDVGLVPTFTLGFSRGAIWDAFKNSGAVNPSRFDRWGNLWALVLDTSQHPFPFLPYKQHSLVTLSFNNSKENALSLVFRAGLDTALS